MESKARFLYLEVSGDEAVKSASELLGRIVGAVAAPASVAGLPATSTTAIASLPAPEAEPPADTVAPAKRIVRKGRPPKYRKPDDEPDGFRMAAPAASKPVGILNPKRGREVTNFNGNGKAKSPLGLQTVEKIGPQIVQFLGRTNGVSALEILVKELGYTAQSINRAVGHSDELKRMPDGRVAMADYRDDD